MVNIRRYGPLSTPMPPPRDDWPLFGCFVLIVLGFVGAALANASAMPW